MSTLQAAGWVTAPSNAKINWNLRVVCRRPDGFHEIESLVSPIDLRDGLEFWQTAEPGFVLCCETPGLPLDDRNLIVKAARALSAGAHRDCGAACELTKRIPIGGGLGGGSSNAAVALTTLNDLWGLGRSATELSELAACLGSDVPFFLTQGSAILRGRGERLERVEVDFRGCVLLLLPGFPVSTAAVYAACRPGTRDNRSVEPVAGLDGRGWMERAFNDLEPAAQQVCPELAPIMHEAAGITRRPVRMSGSGSTLFTAFDTHAEAQAAAFDVKRHLKLETLVVQIAGQAGE